MIPSTRTEFKKYCLRRLGDGVIQINISDEQAEDRIDQALLYMQDYHFEGSEKTYYKYLVQEEDITNGYITLPENIMGAVNIFPPSSTVNSSNIFDIRYQIMLNDLYTLSSVSMVPYYMTFQQLQLIEELLVGVQPIRFNRHTGILYIDMSWSTKIQAGEYIVVEAYMVVDPDVYPRMWGDRWLADYTTCLLKLQWADNISKFRGVPMPGGVMFNGDQIRNDAIAEKLRLENQMINTYSLPNSMFIG